MTAPTLAPHRPETGAVPPSVRRRFPCGPVLTAACGAAFLLVAIAFTGGRAQAGWASGVYWAGQVLLIAATGWACLHPRPATAWRVAALFGFTAAQFGIKLAYAPLHVKFADELQHWQTTLGMLESGRLFPVNHSLPISPVFPGLEILTVAVMRVTALPFFGAAMVVCAASTLLLTASVLVLLRQVTPRWDVVCLAALVYLCNPNHGFFTSMFLYTTPALPLLALCLAQVVSLLRKPSRPAGRIVLALAFAGGVLVTHHLTMVVTLALLGGTTVTAAALPKLRKSVLPLAAVAGGAFSLSAAWVVLVAPAVVGYLGGPLLALAETFTSAPTVGGEDGAPVSTKPLTETLFSLSAILVLAASTGLIGLWALRERRWGLAIPMIGVAGLECAIVLIRVVSPRGEELAGRSPAYVTLLVAVALAAGLHQVGPLRGPRWYAASGAALLVLFVGGITAGWPPNWLRLPGTYHVSGYEAAVDRHTLELGWWARANLPAGTRFVADFGNQTVLGTIGGLDPVNSPTDIFYRGEFSTGDRYMVQELNVRWLVVDRRLTDAPPIRGTYFIGEHEVEFDNSRPFPAASLAKFETVEGMSVAFDDGVIRVYDLRNSRYAW